MPLQKKTTVLDDEIAQFSRLAGEWWNPDGALRPLHRLNPLRLAYIRDQIRGAGLGQDSPRSPLKNITLLDVGCGGGLAAEPLARMGAKVTGLDASADAIAEAKRHAKQSGLAITYQSGAVEDMANGSARYDVITALEIVEHVGDLDMFIASLARLLKPNGLLILSTLNRTPKSFLLGIIAAEYLLRWVPRGTHRWSQFLRPSELVRRLETVKVETIDLSGIVFNPFSNGFSLSHDNLDVNYMLTAQKQ